jgi:hypothetical protein
MVRASNSGSVNERNTVNEKEKTERGPGGLQRGTEKEKLRREIKAIREGHLTGGYCETETLHAQEKKLDKILRAELEESKAKHGYSPDPKFKHPEIGVLELELNGLSWKPLLVAAHEQP